MQAPSVVKFQNLKGTAHIFRHNTPLSTKNVSLPIQYRLRQHLLLSPHLG
ncbi:hypothetical protein NMYAN_20040 [Nitrosomonas nitrosa]|uniref:Uncharacterized protein n=1 Tax=Nitrosomonas nitrosa TaxID=52442 RepID=A0A8H9D932_9PROT|nr:hypothetical protein NMYAN_20040 [Nitrosomonas nitrosa]